LGVFDVTEAGLKIIELAPEVAFDDVQSKTGVPLMQ
jgi:3-oxoacid CoA-transferase subunit B